MPRKAKSRLTSRKRKGHKHKSAAVTADTATPADNNPPTELVVDTETQDTISDAISTTCNDTPAAPKPISTSVSSIAGPSKRRRSSTIEEDTISVLSHTPDTLLPDILQTPSIKKRKPRAPTGQPGCRRSTRIMTKVAQEETKQQPLPQPPKRTRQPNTQSSSFSDIVPLKDTRNSKNPTGEPGNTRNTRTMAKVALHLLLPPQRQYVHYLHDQSQCQLNRSNQSF